MHRRYGAIRGTAAAVPQAHSFLSWQKRHSAPFSLRGKEKAAGGKKKTAKGDFDFPLCNPLKTTKKGAAAPFLGFSPEFGLRAAPRPATAGESSRFLPAAAGGGPPPAQPPRERMKMRLYCVKACGALY